MVSYIRVFIILLVCVSSVVNAGSVKGTIRQLFVAHNGSIALKLNEPFSAELVESECSTYNGFAGTTSADPEMKSALLAAYEAGDKVSLCIEGCDGRWLKIRCVYMTKQ